MLIMTRAGRAALERISREGGFVRGLHSIGELDPERRFIMHFPEELAIESFGSGYGGNALLGKKCHALRIASWQARSEGWLAEHMLIVGLESPRGETHYMACAFPSACGKTNLAMLIPPDSLPGWRVYTVGDDIAWLHPGDDGRLWAINPEAGYFGVVPGTNPDTNRNAYEMIRRDTLFTNVALTADNQPWWEGLTSGKPVLDWQGRPYDPARGPAAHPNSRFTVSAHRNPSYSPHAKTRAVCRSRPWCSAVGGARWRRWCMRRATGSTGFWWAPRSPPRRPPRPWARWASCGAIPWRCSPSAATTSATTGSIGSTWARSLSIRRGSITSTGSAGTRMASSSGQATARICGCSPGCWTGAPGGPVPRETPIGYLPRPQDLDMPWPRSQAGRAARPAARWTRRYGGKKSVRSAIIWQGSAHGCRRTLLAELTKTKQRLG